MGKIHDSMKEQADVISLANVSEERYCCALSLSTPSCQGNTKDIADNKKSISDNMEPLRTVLSTSNYSKILQRDILGCHRYVDLMIEEY